MPHAAWRNASMHLIHWAMWFELVNVRLTTHSKQLTAFTLIR
jgi:hypothetical protein